MKHQTKYSMHLIFVLLLGVALSACAPQAAPTPSLAELQATAMAAAQGNIALTAAAMPTATMPPTQIPPMPVPQFILPTLPAIQLPTVVVATATPGGGTQGACNSFTFDPATVDVTVPDKTVMTPGQVFTKTWLIQNNGTCAWNTGYKLVFFPVGQLNGPDKTLAIPVNPGQWKQISVVLTAPTMVGHDYAGNWRWQNDKGDSFGTFLTVLINVQIPAPTSTSTSTPTPVPPTPTP